LVGKADQIGWLQPLNGGRGDRQFGKDAIVNLALVPERVKSQAVLESVAELLERRDTAAGF